MCNSHAAPQAKDTFLTSTSETDSESVVAFNFGGSTGVLVILVMAVVLSFFLYQLCRCCMHGRCSKQQRPTNDNQAVNSAIITLALAIGQQQNVSQQQQHQQVQDHQQQQPTRVTPGYSYSTVNQALLPTAPALQSTRPYQALLATVGKAAGNSGDTRV